MSDLMATHRLAPPEPSPGSLCFPPLEGGTAWKPSSGGLILSEPWERTWDGLGCHERHTAALLSELAQPACPPPGAGLLGHFKPVGGVRCLPRGRGLHWLSVLFPPHSLQSPPMILERGPGRCQTFGAQKCTSGAFSLCWELVWNARCLNPGGPGPSDLFPVLLLPPLRVPYLSCLLASACRLGDPRLSHKPWVHQLRRATVGAAPPAPNPNCRRSGGEFRWKEKSGVEGESCHSGCRLRGGGSWGGVAAQGNRTPSLAWGPWPREPRILPALPSLPRLLPDPKQGLPPHSPEAVPWPCHLPNPFRLLGPGFLGRTKNPLLSGTGKTSGNDTPVTSRSREASPTFCVLQVKLWSFHSQPTRACHRPRMGYPPRPDLGTISGPLL